MLKILLFIATKKGFEVLKTINEYDHKLIGLVTTFNERDILDSYTEKIRDFCLQNKISFIEWAELKNKICLYVRDYKITDAFAVGFRYIIPIEINKFLKHGLIIFHDSILPRFRGFAPTPTAIMCGEKEIGMSVLFASEKIDTGSIILQKKCYIDENIYINEAIRIQCNLYKEAVKDVINMIINDNIVAKPQNEKEATYSIWRSPEDCLIDWNDSSMDILNLIRAVSYPYTGAYTFYNGQKITVWKAKCVNDIKFELRNPGKVWEIDENGYATVVCGQGMLKLEEVTDTKRNKFIMKKLRTKLG